MPKRTNSITRMVLFMLSLFLSLTFSVVVIKNIIDDRVIVGVLSSFTTLVSVVAGFFFGSQQPEGKEKELMDKYDALVANQKKDESINQ